MKTAGQIAADLWLHVEAGNLAQHSDDLTPDSLAEIVKAAIEADRAQRPVVNWDEVGQLVQAYHEAVEGWSADAEHEAAQDVIAWIESALEGSAR